MDATERKKRAAEEASEWWVLLQGEPSRTEREQYVDWLRESSVHVAEMLRIAQVHGALAQFERWGGLPPDDAQAAPDADEPRGTVIPLPSAERPHSPPPPADRSSHRFRVAWAIAATLLLVAGASALLLIAPRGQTIETQRGERREVALADGSVVQVDPETRLRVDYEREARRVFLERGRALFHVAKNPQRPFLVQADDTTVRAVGTAFAVEQGEDRVVVTVAEGKVSVRSTQHPEPQGRESGEQGSAMPAQKTAETSSTTRSAGAKEQKQSGQETPSSATDSSGSALGEVLLSANQQVTVEASGSAEPVREVDSHKALAWAEGRLIFENRSVEEAVREFNRYNRIHLSVNDAALAKRTISGVFNASDPESFVAFIETVAPVRVNRDEGQNVAIGSAK